jgi:hypothetical protein
MLRKVLAMNHAKLFTASILILLFSPAVFSQTGNERSYENGYRGVSLSVVSQRWIPKEKVPYVGVDVIDFSDMIVRFRLENRGKEDIYYLADNAMSSIAPVGFQVFRKTEGAEWEGTYSPARGREGIFTGVGVHWLLLPPRSAVEFEREDVSDKGGEHATTVYLNIEPRHKNRVELVSDTYRPLRRDIPRE